MGGNLTSLSLAGPLLPGRVVWYIRNQCQRQYSISTTTSELFPVFRRGPGPDRRGRFHLGYGNNTLSLQTANNGGIVIGNGTVTTGTGLFTMGGNLTFTKTGGATITGPSGGLTETVGSGPLTLSTTTSGALSLTSAGALALTGAAASTWDIGNNTLSLQNYRGALRPRWHVYFGWQYYLSGTTARSITDLVPAAY